MAKMLFVLICFVGSLVMTGASALAADTPSLISSHETWKVFSFMDGPDKVCFISSQPQKQEGKFKKRGEVFFFITHWTAEKNKNVVSVSNGYAFKNGNPATVTIDSKDYPLFTQGEMAWTKDLAMDETIIAGMKKGSLLLVKGVSARGTETTDTYSLKGISAAYQAMSNECKG